MQEITELGNIKIKALTALRLFCSSVATIVKTVAKYNTFLSTSLYIVYYVFILLIYFTMYAGTKIYFGNYLALLA